MRSYLLIFAPVSRLKYGKIHEKNTVGQRRTKFVVFFEYAKQIKDKKMLKKSFLPGKVMSLCAVLLLPMAFIVEGISGQTTKFSSVYTDKTKQCKGQEPIRA